MDPTLISAPMMVALVNTLSYISNIGVWVFTHPMSTCRRIIRFGPALHVNPRITLSALVDALVDTSTPVRTNTFGCAFARVIIVDDAISSCNNCITTIPMITVVPC